MELFKMVTVFNVNEELFRLYRQTALKVVVSEIQGAGKETENDSGHWKAG
jgi:hypothetical protein